MRKWLAIIGLILIISLVGCSDTNTLEVTFSTDTHTTVYVYDDVSLGSYTQTQHKNVSKGENGANIYFKIMVESGYTISSITSSDTSLSVSLVDSTNGIYQILGINKNISITITTTSSSVSLDPFIATFVPDSHVTVTVYDTQAYTNGSDTLIATAKDGDTGVILTDGEGQINFTLDFEDGYELNNILVTPSSNYNKVKLPDELGLNYYRVTQIEGNITLNITSKLVGEVIIPDGFEATFVLDSNVTVTVFDTQALINGVTTNTAIAKDADTGEVLINGQGQINFQVNLSDGYIVDSITISPNEYNNLKLPIELGINTYRITKITADITVTITTRIAPTGYIDTEPTVITLSNDSSSVTNNNGYVTIENNSITITGSGDYVVSGSLSNGSIQVDASDTSDLNFTFYDTFITSTSYAPIQILNANNVTFTVLSGYTLALTDNRPASITEAMDPLNAALYVNADLLLTGEGSITIDTTYNNGIVCKDDLEIKNLTIDVLALNNGIKGSDSLSIYSGNITVTAQGGDAIKTSNSDISSSGTQRGLLMISGGTLLLNAATDGIDSAYDLVITSNPVITINTTPTYATNVGSPVEQSTSSLYVRISANLYSSSYRYAVLFSNSSNTLWVDATYSGVITSMNRTYYLYKLDMPSGYQSYTLFRFTSTQVDSTTTFNAKSSVATINTNYDSMLIGSTGITGSTITYSFGVYSTSGSSFSAKGLKADNEIYIAGGNITISAYDDGIHANSDTQLENGSYGLGDVTILGGFILITTKDDGIHADRYLLLQGGTIHVITSYEGFEGNQITLSGGEYNVFSTDDGLNASSGSYNPSITVTGGILTVSVGTGDTDAIDSNGSYSQTGGYVLSMSALSGGMGGALDTDASYSITGGTFIGIGQSERIPTSAGNNRATGAFSLSITPATYYVKNGSTTVFTFTTSTYTYSQIFMTSDQLKSGSSYSLYRGSTSIKTWTQN